MCKQVFTALGLTYTQTELFSSHYHANMSMFIEPVHFYSLICSTDYRLLLFYSGLVAKSPKTTPSQKYDMYSLDKCTYSLVQETKTHKKKFGFEC